VNGDENAQPEKCSSTGQSPIQQWLVAVEAAKAAKVIKRFFMFRLSLVINSPVAKHLARKLLQ
jgi:hypothetical protein